MKYSNYGIDAISELTRHLYNLTAGIEVNPEENSSYFSKKEDDGFMLGIPCLGYSKEEIKISVLDGILIVSSKDIKKDSFPPKNEFSRKFKFSSLYDIEGITAKMENGILILKIPYNKTNTKDIKIE